MSPTASRLPSGLKATLETPVPPGSISGAPGAVGGVTGEDGGEDGPDAAKTAVSTAAVAATAMPVPVQVRVFRDRQRDRFALFSCPGSLVRRPSGMVSATAPPSHSTN